MPSVRITACLLLVVGSTACTALLGASDVPDPQATDGGDVPDSTTALPETGSTGSGSSSSGAETGSSSGSSSSGSVEASSESSGPTMDGSPESSDDSSITEPDAGDDAGGCGPLTSTTNCGACGVACDTSTGAPSCVGTTCTYMCNPGHLDCNAVNGPDTDGCECTTPGCCGTSCETTHHDGLGHDFYDCFPFGTHTPQTAMEACQAYATAIGGNPSACSTGYYCTSGVDEEACYVPMSGGTDCWAYLGQTRGQVTDFSCPSTKLGTYN
jgi:hypothetical protein